MIAELMCAWCICTTGNGRLLECSACNVGTQEEGLKRLSQFTIQAGQMGMIECKKPGEQFDQKWESKGLKVK